MENTIKKLRTLLNIRFTISDKMIQELIDALYLLKSDTTKAKRELRKLMVTTKNRPECFTRRELYDAHEAIEKDCWTFSYNCLGGYDWTGCFKRTNEFKNRLESGYEGFDPKLNRIVCECGLYAHLMITKESWFRDYVLFPYIKPKKIILDNTPVFL